MRNTGLREIHPDKILLRRFNALANGLRNFLGLARSVAHNRGGRIADHDQRGEREILAALDYLGHAVDGDHLIFQLIPSGVELFNHCWHS